MHAVMGRGSAQRAGSAPAKTFHVGHVARTARTFTRANIHIHNTLYIDVTRTKRAKNAYTLVSKVGGATRTSYDGDERGDVASGGVRTCACMRVRVSCDASTRRIRCRLYNSIMKRLCKSSSCYDKEDVNWSIV